MTHQRAMLQPTTEPNRMWFAGIHRCPDQVIGTGLGTDPDEAFENARIGLRNAISIHSRTTEDR